MGTAPTRNLVSGGASGRKLLGKFKVGAFAATFAASQMNRLLALSGWCYGAKHDAGCTVRARRRLVDFWWAVAHASPKARLALCLRCNSSMAC
jgi:hypothetical protein